MSVSKRISIALALVLLAAASVHAAQTPGAAVTVEVSGTKVTASGITPNGQAVFFGMMRARKDDRAFLMRHDSTVTDTDGDGVVTLDLQHTVPWKSVWSVVDFTSGRYGIAAPPGFPRLALRRDEKPIPLNNGQLTHLDLATTTLELLVVRPGTGAWTQMLGDGTPFDDDKTPNGKVKAKAAGSLPMSAFKDKAAPEKFEKDDVIVLIDRVTLQFFAGQVGEKK